MRFDLRQEEKRRVANLDNIGRRAVREDVVAVGNVKSVKLPGRIHSDERVLSNRAEEEMKQRNWQTEETVRGGDNAGAIQRI